MKNKDKKIKMSLIIVVLIGIICIITGITYAYFSANSKTENRVVSTGSLDITYNQGQVIKTEGIYPIKEEQIASKATELNFSVTNNGTLIGYFDIQLKDIIMDDELRDENFRWRLYQNETIVSEGNFLDTNTQLLLTNNIPIEPKETKEYKIIVWIQEINSLQNYMQDKTFKGKITIKALDRQNTFAESESPKLENTTKNEVIALTLKGNSIQNGNPTPETPIEVQSVGDKTKNLLNINNYKIAPDGRIGISVSELEINKKYTITVSEKIDWVKISNSPSGYNSIQILNESGVNSVTFTMTKNSNIPSNAEQYLYISLLNSETFITNLEVLKSLNIQIEEGATSTEYEPYGYKIPIKTTGKNLFNYIDWVEYTKSGIGSDGNTNVSHLGEQVFSYVLWQNNNENMFSNIKFKENTQYTISTSYTFDYNNNEFYGIPYLTVRYTDGTYHHMSVRASSKEFQTLKYTTDAGKTVAGFTIPNFSNQATIYCKYIQVEEGTTATEYEAYQGKTYDIYLDEPLRGIGDTKDYINFKNKTIVRKIRKKELTGNETWSEYLPKTQKTSYTTRFDDINPGFQNSICTHFDNVDSAWEQDVYGIYSDHHWTGWNNANYFNWLPNSTVDEWRSYLSTQYNNKQPITLYYKLLNPSDPISIDVPDIKAFDGTTNISLNTNIGGTFEGNY